MSPSDSSRKPPNPPGKSHLRVVTSTPVEQNATSRTHSINQFKHIVCLAILPISIDQSFDYYQEILLPALRIIFEKQPYYWQLAYSHDYFHDNDTAKNIDAWKKYARIYLVDISNDDASMHQELGRLAGDISRKSKKDKPLLFALCREGTECASGLRREIPRLYYPVGYSRHAIEDFSAISNDHQNVIKHAIEDISEKLKEQFQRRDIITLNDSKEYHYLSISVLNEELSWYGPPANACADAYETMEDFMMSDENDVARLLKGRGIKLNPRLIREYQQGIRDLLGY